QTSTAVSSNSLHAVNDPSVFSTALRGRSSRTAIRSRCEAGAARVRRASGSGSAQAPSCRERKGDRMGYYRRVGEVPRKRHIVHRGTDGGVLIEELMGSDGFSAESALL